MNVLDILVKVMKLTVEFNKVKSVEVISNEKE